MRRAPGQSKLPRDPMAVALNLISYRARTRAELRAQLIRREVPPAEVEAVLERLAELGYLDDERFARDRASALLRSGRLGPRAVAQRLRAHGLGEPQARVALAEAEAELQFDPLAVARQLLARRGLASPEDPKARARAARLLVRRGFAAQVIARALDAAELETELEED